MSPTDYPKSKHIRAALLDRADTFSTMTGVSRRAVGKHSINDEAFLWRVANGHNFTVGTYQRVMDWLDRHWPRSRRQ